MPHQCVKCGKVYEDGSSDIMTGCNCGSRMFFFIKKENLQKLKDQISKLNAKQKETMMTDVYDLIGDDLDKSEPVVLDIESINITKPGTYELDLVTLFKREPLIYKLEEGKYVIDLVESFKNLSSKKKKK